MILGASFTELAVILILKVIVEKQRHYTAFELREDWFDSLDGTASLQKSWKAALATK